MDRLLAALFGIQSIIKPGKVEETLLNFGKEVMRLFDLECFVAEVPMLKLLIKIPENAKCEGISYSGSIIKITFGRGVESKGVDNKTAKVLRSLFERLDLTVMHSVYTEIALNVIQHSPDAVIIVDEDSNIVEMNKKAEEIFSTNIGKLNKLPEEIKEEKEIYYFNNRCYSAKIYDIGRLKAIVLRDVTKIKELEEVARKEEERFRLLAEMVPVGILVFRDGQLTFSNKEAERIAGGKADEIGRDIMKGKDVTFIKDKGGAARVYTSTLHWKDGSEKIVALADVTELEEKKDKLEELTNMLSMINRILRHDALNALAAAMSYLEVYEETKNDEFLKKLKRAIERSVSVIKDLRSLEYAVKKELRVINVRKVVEDVARGFDVHIDIEGDCNVLADEGLRTVFENLFQNAIQHGRTERIDVKIKPTSEWCEVKVADYGKGIPEEIKTKIFDEGFKYGEMAGSGIGLFTVKKLMERYGGEISVDSGKPKGAVFILRLRKAT